MGNKIKKFIIICRGIVFMLPIKFRFYILGMLTILIIKILSDLIMFLDKLFNNGWLSFLLGILNLLVIFKLIIFGFNKTTEGEEFK